MAFNPYVSQLHLRIGVGLWVSLWTCLFPSCVSRKDMKSKTGNQVVRFLTQRIRIDSEERRISGGGISRLLFSWGRSPLGDNPKRLSLCFFSTTMLWSSVSMVKRQRLTSFKFLRLLLQWNIILLWICSNNIPLTLL